jgi:hypothetical protein
MHKILVGHRITSPMLLGIKESGNGLASNADEIKNASQLFQSTVVNNYQDELLDALTEVMELNGEVPELYFITSQPIEFTSEDQEADYTDSTEKEAPVSKEEAKKEDTNLSAHDLSVDPKFIKDALDLYRA